MSFRQKKYSEIKDFIKKSPINKENTPISIVAVTKTQSVETIREAINAGVIFFGENRVQEALAKYKEIKEQHKNLKLHMIGPLQSNKVKKALKIFDYFHTIDRESLAKEFSKYPEITSLKNFFIQINTGEEKQKSGVLPSYANEFINYCLHDLKLNIIGLMCLPPILEEPIKHFKNLKDIAFKNNLRHLSMGMSNDYETAVKCGSTFIRLGSYLFGERHN